MTCFTRATCTLIAALVIAASAWAQTENKDPAPDAAKPKEALGPAARAAGEAPAAGQPAAKPAEQPEYPPFDKVLKDAEKIEGLVRLYRKDDRLFAEVTANDLNKDFLVAIAIARGIGERPLLGGYTWSVDDDWLWQFRKVEKRIQVVRRNIRFTAQPQSPTARAVHLAYTDSVLFSLPIVTKGPAGGDVVDLGAIFMSDLPQIGHVLRGFSFARDRSNWESVKGFKDNVEIQVAATYASSGTASFDTVPDSRGVTINVHYSLSRLPQTGYRPRLADDRVGYFVSVMKDYSKNPEQEHFVRYINRWDLQKADPAAKVSPPKRPIIFWLEKTIPYAYRAPIREGILQWNKAFEKAGFSNAIEVRQQPDDATWDPEDINYNTFRWITAGVKFAQGPSRVNPTTGQILDADVIFDADFFDYPRNLIEINRSKDMDIHLSATLPGGATREMLASLAPDDRTGRRWPDNLGAGVAHQMAFGAAVLATRDKAATQAEIEKMVMQGLQSVATHEVGHTFGLRHNFKASLLLSLDEMHDQKKTSQTGLASSVMDYLPLNIAPEGKPQGDYFNVALGAYDYWAIEYGYKPVEGNSPEAELPALRKIASRSGERELDFATDEDTQDSDPDPLSNRFDMGKDPLAFTRSQAEVIRGLWDKLPDRVTEDGEGYQAARAAFETLLKTHQRAMTFAARFVGGVYIHRDHKGDPDARPPAVVVEAKRQREALKLLETEVFGEKAYDFPPELYNYLAGSHWWHWGSDIPGRPDYPAHDVILSAQDAVLSRLLSPLTLQRLADSELKVPSGEDAFTTAELLERLTKAMYAEVDKIAKSGKGEYTNRKPAIKPLRRALQRQFLQRVCDIALGHTGAPEDCEAIAAQVLGDLEERVREALKTGVGDGSEMDAYTRAHLTQTADRIAQVRRARLELRRP
ncbi:MAG: zinc-dependent metalloprotease [Pirellulales bacterium]|nr:zinc-dependent metalloprotease [Pirellulales bacterium]